MADEGVDHGHNPTSESTFEGAPSASGLHASPSPTTTTVPTPDPAAATSTPITTPSIAEGTGFTGMPTYPAYGVNPPTTALPEATTTSETVASSSAPRWYVADYHHPLPATGAYVDVAWYATLSGLRRGPESCRSRSRGSGRSSNRSLTRSEINEALRGATSKIVGDLTQEIRAKLEPRGTALLVATGVPHDPHMALHALEDHPEDTGHLVVHQRGSPAWLKEHVTALRSWASTIAGAEIRLHDHPAISPGDTRALSVDQLTPSHHDVRWHSADLNAGWLSPTGYYWIREAWGHTSSDASGCGPCKHATSVALAASLTRTWAVAISGTVPNGEGVAASLPLQYGAHRPWVHTVGAEVILHLLRHADRERTTGVPAGAAKAVNQMPLRWLRDGLCARGRHAGHPFWYVRATSHHSDALLHKADWAASQDTVLQNTTPDPGHAQLRVASHDGHLDLRPPRCGRSARSRSGRRQTMR